MGCLQWVFLRTLEHFPIFIIILHFQFKELSSVFYSEVFRCSGLNWVFALKDSTSLYYPVGRISKVCKRKTLIIPSISLECSIKTDYFRELLAYILIFLKLCEICSTMCLGKRCDLYAVSRKKIISQSCEDYITKLIEILFLSLFKNPGKPEFVNCHIKPM